MDNTKGQTSAFATFSPFKSSGARVAELFLLFFAPVNDVLARAPNFLHTAYFARVTPDHLRRAGLASATLRDGALLFVSEYNGDAETYFRGFNRELYPVLDEVWSRCVEWSTARSYANLIQFIEKFRRRSDTFFCAYPDESKRVRASLVLRRQIDRLLTISRSGTATVDADFERAFAHAAQLHWGDAPLTREDQ